MGELPIDIDYAKFLDWLVDRRRVAKGWHASLKAARVLLRSAAEALPPEGSSIVAPSSYFETVDVLEQLLDKSIPPPFPGARDTDVLGRYSHPATRGWVSAKASYESGCAYLAEAAQTLVRNTDLEALALKSEIAKLKETIADCTRREGATLRASAEAHQRFQLACSDFGIEAGTASSLDFEASVRRYVYGEAPGLLSGAIQAAKHPTVAKALAYYEQFFNYASSDIASDLSDDKPDPEVPATPGRLLCRSLTNALKLETEELSSLPNLLSEKGMPLEVDWDVTTTSANETQIPECQEVILSEIDWGIEIDAGGTVAGEAQEVHHTPDGEAPEHANCAAEIDWGQSTYHSETLSRQESSDVSLAGKSSREAYVTDLVELLCFLKQRRAELSRSSDSQFALVLQQSSTVPDIVRRTDEVQIEEMMQAVQLAHDAIAGARSRRILGLYTSDEAVARCARELADKLHVASRLERNISALAARKAHASDQLRESMAKYDTLASQTIELKKRTEKKLETFYSGREVNILGEINVLFSTDG